MLQTREQAHSPLPLSPDVKAGAGAMEDRMLLLAASFPTLRGVLERWDPQALDAFTCGPAPGSGAFHAARFVLSVFNAKAEWQCGRFDLHRALWSWDAEHRAAFMAWARAPWWP